MLPPIHAALPADPAAQLERKAAEFQGARREKAFEDFEAVFLNMLLTEMRKSIPEGGFLRQGPATKVFEQMFDEVMARKMAESGDLGVAAALKAQYAPPELASGDSSSVL